MTATQTVRVGERYDEKVIEASVYNAIGQYLMLAEKQAVQNREVGDHPQSRNPGVR